MDNRISTETTQLREIIDRALSRINTCIPGIIDSFDSDRQTATVIPAVSMKTFVDEEEGILPYPPIINAPVIFPFAATSGFALTLPIRQGDPCIILFSQRSIDNWHDLGGIQPSEEGVSSRHHDLTDAIVLLAAPPAPHVLGSWEGDGIQIRNRAGTNKITVFDDKIIIESSTEVIIDTPNTTISGDTTINGRLMVDDNVILGGTVKNLGVNIGSTHTHNQGNDLDGDIQVTTGVPQ